MVTVSWGALVRPFRDPITLGLAVMFLALLVVTILRAVRKKKKEGWTFEGDKDEMTDKHEAEVVKLCEAGWTMEQIEDSDKDYLAKYTRNDVAEACKRGTASRRKLEGNIGNKDILKNCKHGPCPVLTMQATRPCLNKAGDKCCNSDIKNCRNPQEAGITNWRFIQGKLREKDDAEGRNIDWKNQVYEWGPGCKFVSATQKTWDPNYTCPNAFPHKTGVSDDERLRQTDAWKYQCAQGAKCAQLVKDYWKKHVPGRDADRVKGFKTERLEWVGIPNCRYTPTVEESPGKWRCPNEFPHLTGVSEREDLRGKGIWRFQCATSQSCANTARGKIPPAPTGSQPAQQGSQGGSGASNSVYDAQMVHRFGL